jgi:hypothetical protein
MRNSILTIVAGLLVVIAVQVAGTAAAGGTPSAGKSASKIALSIHLKRSKFRGHFMGGRFVLSGVTYTQAGGVFTRSGAISDRGTFGEGCVRECLGPLRFRTLRGAKGTIQVGVPRKGHWSISKGTKSYAGLLGRGRERGQYSRGLRRAIDVTMTGTLSR